MTSRNRLAWLAITAAVLLAAWISLRRLQEERLFLFSMPFERGPSSLEIHDAALTARRWTLPALVFLVIWSFAIVLTVRNGPVVTSRDLLRRLCELSRKHPALCVLFAIACLADLLSTEWYFHKYSLEDELHPAIKLVTYAWGLSVGCLAAKLIQATLVLLVCAVFPRIARPLLTVISVAYVAAAFWNCGII